jgi:hypothetical protein
MNYNWTTLAACHCLTLSYSMTRPQQCCQSYKEIVPILSLLFNFPRILSYCRRMFLGATEKPQNPEVSGPKLKPEISRIRRRSISHSPSCSVHFLMTPLIKGDAQCQKQKVKPDSERVFLIYLFFQRQLWVFTLFIDRFRINQQTQQKGVFFEKLIVVQLVKKFLILYETIKFVTVFRAARYWTLFWPIWIHSTLSSYFFKIHFNIILLLH